MNEAERKKCDEAEASGQLPRLRLVVKSFCAPIWWEIDHKTILGNGSMCVIATPQSVFGVTANHVLTIYEGHKVAHPDAFCQLGSAPFDPIPNLIARSEHWDLATFGIPDFTLKHWGRHHRIYKTEAWPPPAIKNNDPVILGGYPTNRRTQVPGERPATMTIDFVSFIARADNWSESHMAFCFDSNNWYWPQGEGLPPNPELSGASGGPCFLMVPEKDRIELAGFVYEASTKYEVIRVRQANLIATDGTIAPPAVGACRREANDEKPSEQASLFGNLKQGP